jgi:hypothetical protein
MHRNDLENILAFLAIGLIFVAINPSLLVAQLLFYGFVVRLLHSSPHARRPHQADSLNQIRADLRILSDSFRWANALAAFELPIDLLAITPTLPP